ncbi:tRNA dihydrouridine synthase DusB [Candidatus Bathyarchaeota archaeon]|nr:MAG: tRNA dihydrouridine synthase DusB [Candidatus Bathyarchaeota archaeon]
MSSTGFNRRLRAEKLLLPPLAGYTDYPFRRILAEHGAPFMCTQMLSSEAVVRRSPRTLKMLEKPDGGHLHGAQLFGDDAVSMASAAVSLEALGFDYVDINMGCAVKAVISNGAGVSLMGDLEKAYRVAATVVEAVSIPVTCKIRLGESRREQNALELSGRLVDAGVSAITVHGRSGEKKFGEPVNYDAIREIVESVDVPVVGNGGVYTGFDALEMVRLTGVDAVMPGRGLIGNPWIIEEIRCAFNGESFAAPSLDERKTVCRRHLGYLVDYVGEKDGVVTMRRVLPRYFSGAVHATDLREFVVNISSVGGMLSVLDRLVEVGDQVVFQRV